MTKNEGDTGDSTRVLIFAPIGRDASASAELLRLAHFNADACTDFDHLVSSLDESVGAVLIAEEGLFGQSLAAIGERVAKQPPWSDLPFVMLTGHQERRAIAAWREKVVGSLRNVSLLERPVHALTLTSALRAALRARKRQFELRDLINAQDRAAQDLERLVAERTGALAAANAELCRQMEERTKVEETLRQAQRIEAIGRLTGGVAHDFNNLLMVISGGLDMLERKADPVRRARLIDGMKQAAQRGAGLTRQLLAFSRRQELKPEPIDIAEQIGGMRELLDRSLRGDVHVSVEFADDLWPIEVDPGELELVVLNLAVNARDAMPDGGTIRLIAENVGGVANPDMGGDFVRIRICDTGIGMPAEVRERVFEPFFTTKEIGRGSGLGLAQVYGFVKQSGGTIEIDSDVGRGTVITLLLPRSYKTPRQKERHLLELQPERHEEGSAGCVLLVEDDDEVAAMATEMLSELGYKVTRAASADAALGALADSRKVDLVFSDVMMPGGRNGVDLAREIRRRRRNLPVLLTSGYAEAARRQAEAVGVAILPKPYRITDLAAALSRAVSSRPA